MTKEEKAKDKAAAERDRRELHNRFFAKISNQVPSLFKAKHSSKKKSRNDQLRLISSYMSTITAPFFKNAVEGKKDDRRVYDLLAEQNIIICNGSLLCLYVSQACLSMLGYNCVDLVGNEITHLLPPNEVDSFIASFNSFKSDVVENMKERKTFSIKCWMRGSGGTTISHFRKVCFSGVITLNNQVRELVPKQIKVVRRENGHMTFKSSESSHDSANLDSVIQVVGQIELLSEPFDPRLVYTFFESKSYQLVTDGVSKILYASHGIALVTGLSPEDVQNQLADLYIHPEDRAYSLEARKRIICSGIGTIVNRLFVHGQTLYVECIGRYEKDGNRSIFIIKATEISGDEGRIRRDADASAFAVVTNESTSSIFPAIDINLKEPELLNYIPHHIETLSVPEVSSSLTSSSSTCSNTLPSSSIASPSTINMQPVVHSLPQPPVMVQYDLSQQQPTTETYCYSQNSSENTMIQSAPISSQSFCLIYNSTIPCGAQSQTFMNPVISFQNPILINASNIQFITQVPTNEAQFTDSSYTSYHNPVQHSEGNDPLPFTNEVSYRNLDEFINISNIHEDQLKH